MTHKESNVVFNNGTREVGATIVKHNTDGTVDLHAAEGDSDAVKEFSGIPEGEGGLTFKRA